MNWEILMSVGGVALAIVVWVQQMKSSIDQMKKDMEEGFTRHREEHQEHHKEIAKMFDSVTGVVNQHITEERVRHAEEKKEHDQILHYIEYHTCEKCNAK